MIEWEQMFEDFFGRALSLPGRIRLPSSRLTELAAVSPSVDLFEKERNVVLKAELTGMKREDISLHLSGDTLFISSEKKQEQWVAKKNCQMMERSQGSFTRSVKLPADVEADKAKATLRTASSRFGYPRQKRRRRKRKNPH